MTFLPEKTGNIENKIKDKSGYQPPPHDRFFLNHVLFFLLGIIHFLPITFFSAANNYWIYKFRNVDDLTGSAQNRTVLQSYFAASSTAAGTIPFIFCALLSTYIGHKVRVLRRIFYSLFIECIVFISLTVFVKIDTDKFQLQFFIFVMVGHAILSGSNTINTVSAIIVYSKFPHKYMKIYLYGEGTAGLMSASLQVFAVAVFDHIIDSALLYFIVGSSVMTFTLFFFALVQNTHFFKYYMEKTPEDTKKKAATKQEMLSVFKKIWPSISIFAVMLAGLAASQNSITSLVISENSGNPWSDKFFVPVVTFLLSDIWSLLGRFIASHLKWKMSQPVLLVVVIVRTILLVPCIWLCHAYPRNHLPVIFSHDWQYAIILGVLMVTNGYILNISILNIASVAKGETELAFNVFMLSMGIFQAITSPIGFFSVKVL